MRISATRLGLLLACVVLSAFSSSALADAADKLLTLETKHYRVAYEGKHARLAGEILQVAESVWPTLARAYDSYDHYQRIDILVTDDSDQANGYAIYNFSRVAIYAPNMDWVMRNRQGWIRNVVTHELAHVFSLRRAAWLSPVDAVNLYGSTYNARDRINYSFQLPWIPLIAPSWYIEGVAQFEAFENGNDAWDSQRDMILRDAYLTGTLPTLDFIETFEYDEDWTQSERVYNTGYAFLLYLKDRFGADKVRALARPKPLANFSYSVRKAMGRELTDLFEDFKRSLSDRYADFREMPVDTLADAEMTGRFQQNLAFSRDGRYMAWLGNDEDRRYPLNWIFWKDLKTGNVEKSGKPADLPAPANPSPPPSPAPAEASFSGYGPAWTGSALVPESRPGNPTLGLGKIRAPVRSGSARFGAAARYGAAHSHDHGGRPGQGGRSEEVGSSGLEFNHDGTRLLTTRQDRHSRYTDLWEYEFRARKSEAGKWRRLTWEERAAYPSYHPSRDLIVYTRKQGGSGNLAILDSAGRTRQLTLFSDGEQVYNPRFTSGGDSIYFTLGIGDREAIVSIDASAPAYQPFADIRESGAFPDSLKIGAAQRFHFITPLRPGGIRNLRFSNDTLLWSSNTGDSVYSVYDVYARLPGDSVIYRATRSAGQALEPLVHKGILYYQGYRRQEFHIFRKSLDLAPTPSILRPSSDSLPIAKMASEMRSAELDSGEYRGSKVALDITPFLALQPQFISGDRSYLDLALGLTVSFGEAYGNWMQSLSGAVTKRTDTESPLNYQFQYAGFLSSEAISHNRFTWPVNLYYNLYHDIVQTYGSDSYTYPVEGEPLMVTERVDLHSRYSRFAASAALPLPATRNSAVALGAGYFLQRITQDYSQSFEVHDLSAGETERFSGPRISFLRDAQQHRHYETNISWSWSKGALATFLPTGGNVWAQLHKFWATYSGGERAAFESVNANRYAQEGRTAPVAVLVQSSYEPWALEFGTGGVFSIGRNLSLFANAEAGAFLNAFPKTPTPAHIQDYDGQGYDTTFVGRQADGLWVMSYRIGYYRLSGYPYNFTYRGRDIMEGSSFAFGQYGIQVPIKLGAFLPGLPATSFKQFLITGMGEWATALNSSPQRIYETLENGEHHLLLDFGLRVSMNFRLYHRLPFTVFAQGFVPWNKLKGENLYWFDYPHTGAAGPGGSPSAEQIANDPSDRKRHMDQVKDPRFFVGFNLGVF